LLVFRPIDVRIGKRGKPGRRMLTTPRRTCRSSSSGTKVSSLTVLALAFVDRERFPRNKLGLAELSLQSITSDKRARSGAPVSPSGRLSAPNFW
jgi:hypothetical protein